jgi:hypothetical protein
MRETTAAAEGTKYKGGAKRRIVITMDERLFLDIRALAVDADRSFSAQVVRYLEKAVTDSAPFSQTQNQRE